MNKIIYHKNKGKNMQNKFNFKDIFLKKNNACTIYNFISNRRNTLLIYLNKIFRRLITKIDTSLATGFIHIISDTFENLLSSFLNSSMYGIIENNKNSR